jgi:hypothetical protein
MAKKIIDLVRAKKARMEEPTPGGEQEATDNSKLAIAAIIGGIKSEAWRAYMLQFVDKDEEGKEVDPRQLQRLLAMDDTAGDEEMDLHRVYMVSNGPCGAASPDGLGFDFAVDSIDNGLDHDCLQPTFKPADMPATAPDRNK